MISSMVRHLTSPAFVGREAQLDALLGLARADGPAVALVGGEAGVGKTRLVSELMQHAEADRTLCVVGGCLEFGEQVFPLAPAAAILRSLSERVDATTLDHILGAARTELSRLVPEFVDTPAAGDPLPSHRLFELLLGALNRMTHLGRVVLVIEDLHWADASSLDLFGFLARLLRGPVLMVGTYRSDELHRQHPLRPLLAEVRRATHPEDISLGPLSRAEVAELIAGLTDRPADGRLAAEVHRRSNGNPFYAEELIAAGEERSVPGTLRDVVLGRATSLGEDAFRLLCVAAAAGGIDDLDAVSSVAGLPADTASVLLPDIAANGLLVPDGTGWRFRHELAREVFEDQLLPGDRTRVHAGLADQLRERRPDQAGRISRHLWWAGDQPRALEWSIRAARSAEQVGAMAEAQVSYERALDVWDHVPDAADRVDWSRANLLLTAAEAAFRAGRHPRAVDLVQRAIDELAGDPVAQGGAWMQLVPYLWMAGRPGVREAMTRALELVPASPSLERAWVLATSGLVHLWQGQPAEAKTVSQEALEVVRAVGDAGVESQRVQAWARNVFAAAEGWLGDPAAPDMLRQVLEQVREIGDPDQIGRAYVNLTAALGSHGRYEDVLTVAAEGEHVLADLGNRLGSGIVVTFNKQDALLHLGRWDELEAAATEMWDAADLAAHSGFLLTYGMVQLRRGRLAGAREVFTASGSEHADGTQPEIRAAMSLGLVELAVHDRSWDEARALVERTFPMLLDSSPAAAAEVVAAGIAAEAERISLRPDHDASQARAVADRWLGQVRSAAQPLSDTALGAQLSAWLAQAAAERRRLDKQPDPDQWTQVATAWEGLKRPYDAAYAWLRAGEAVLLSAGIGDAGQRARAADLLKRAHDRAGELGAVRITEHAVTLARQARLQLGDPAPSPEPSVQDHPFDLTDREIQVLALLADGKSNGEIGAALFVSRKTASTHVSHILRKLGAGNRVEAAAVAHRAGLVGDVWARGQ